MANVKVKFRLSKSSDRSGSIYFQITHRRLTRQVSTRIRIPREEWDFARQRMLCNGNTSSIARSRVECGVAHLRAIIRKLEAAGDEYTADDIVRQFRTPALSDSLSSFMGEQIDYLRRCNRFGTAKNYEHTLRSFRNFIGGDIPIAAITEQLVDNYNAFLVQRGIVRNSVSFYMRVLRAVYNKAVRRRLVEQTNPFRNVYTGIDKTRKRAIDEELIVRLYRLDLRSKPELELTRDIFIFSYCTRGMAFVDMAYLRKSDIQNGAISYTRHKTGQLLTVRIEPGMRSIIERYSGITGGLPYVFPILTSVDVVEMYRQYRAAINTYNRRLKELSRMVQSGCRFTSYTARHSWATSARRHNAPVSVISAGLGHTSERTTQIYLTSLENSTIDAVNRGIISTLSA